MRFYWDLIEEDEMLSDTSHLMMRTLHNGRQSSCDRGTMAGEGKQKRGMGIVIVDCSYQIKILMAYKSSV